MSAPPAVSDPGFVRVACQECQSPEVWLRCNECGKSDHFAFDGQVVTCDCGATYNHATCTCGARVVPLRLTFVRWEDGPMALADLEWDWGRIAILAGIVVVLGGAGAWLVFG